VNATTLAEVPQLAAVPGSVILTLSTDQARTLANVLAHYDLLVNHSGPADRADGYEPEVWHHTLLQLHRCRTKATDLAESIADQPVPWNVIYEPRGAS